LYTYTHTQQKALAAVRVDCAVPSTEHDSLKIKMGFGWERIESMIENLPAAASRKVSRKMK